MNSGNCNHCGQPLSVGPGQAICGRCLMRGLMDDDDSGSALDVRTAEHRIAGYTILEELGRGGMGVVYRAVQSSPRREVALKMLLPGQFRPDIRTRFLVEAQALAALEHPHILPLYECGDHDGQPYFTTRVAAGGSLATRLARGRVPIPARRAAELLRHLADAMDYAHQRGVIHRDLKPSNILFDHDDSPVIGDFGLARITGADGSVTVASTMMGSPNYLAPEIAATDARAATTFSDLYGLGAVLYELLAGRPPYVAETAMEVIQLINRSEVVPPSRLDGISCKPPRDLELICMKCLARLPMARYTGAGALRDDLECWLQGRPVSARAASPLERLWSGVRRNPLPALLAGTLMVTVVAAVILLSMAVTRARSGEAKAEASRAFADGISVFLLGEFTDRLRAAGHQPMVNDLFASIGDRFDREPIDYADPHGLRARIAFLLRWAEQSAVGGNVPSNAAAVEFAVSRCTDAAEHARRLSTLSAPDAPLLEARALLLSGRLHQRRESWADAELAYRQSESLLSPGSESSLVRARLRVQQAEILNRTGRLPGDWLPLLKEAAESLADASRDPDLSQRLRRELGVVATDAAHAELEAWLRTATDAGSGAVFDEAIRAALGAGRRALDALKSRPRLEGPDPEQISQVGTALQRLSTVLKVAGGDSAGEATAALDESEELLRRFIRDDPANHEARWDLARNLQTRAELLRQEKRYSDEWNTLIEVESLYHDILQGEPAITAWLRDAAHAIDSIAVAARDTASGGMSPAIPWSRVAPVVEPCLDDLRALARNSVVRSDEAALLSVVDIARDFVRLYEREGLRAKADGALEQMRRQIVSVSQRDPLNRLAEAALLSCRCDILSARGDTAAAMSDAAVVVDTRAAIIEAGDCIGQLGHAGASAFSRYHRLLKEGKLDEQLADSLHRATTLVKSVCLLRPAPDEDWRGSWAAMSADAAEALAASGRPGVAGRLAAEARTALFPPGKEPGDKKELEADHRLAVIAKSAEALPQ